MNSNKIIRVCEIIIEYGILAIVFLIPLIFDFTRTNFDSFDLFRMVIFRIILSLMAAAYVAKIFIRGKIGWRGSSKIFLLVFLILLSFLTSSFLSVHPDLSFWGGYTRQQGFYSLINYLLFFVLLILNLNSLKQIKRMIIASVGAGALTGFYGLIQLVGLDPLPWVSDSFTIGRVFSSLGQPSFFGHYLVLIMPLSIYALFFIVKKPLSRFSLGLVILAEFTCLINTYSRAAWLGFLGAALFLAVFWLLYKSYKKAAFSLMGALLLAFMLVIGLNIVRPVNQGKIYALNLASRLKSMVDLQSDANKMRYYYWQDSIKEIRRESYKRLLAGYGPDTLDAVFIKYYQPDWAIHEVINTYNDRAHNWLFDVILTYGLIGLAAMLWFYFYLGSRAAKYLFSREAKPREELWLAAALSASLVAYCINNLFSFSLVVSYVYLFLILAMLWFVVGGPREQEAEIRLMPASKILIWSGLLVVVLLFIYSENINAIRANYFYMKARKAEKAGDCTGILDNMDRAVNYQAVSTFYKEQFAVHGSNCFSLVTDKDSQIILRDKIEEQIDYIKPREFQYTTWLVTARAQSLFGFYVDVAYYKKAEEIFSKLIADYPYLLTAYEDLGRMRLWQEDYAGAIKLFKQAENNFPSLSDPQLNQEHRKEIQTEAVGLYENTGLAYNRLKNYDQALKYYKQALIFNPNYLDLYKSTADIYYARGQLDQAINLNKRGLTLDPTDYHWPLSLSLLYRERKDLASARKYLEQAIKLAPENAELKKYQQELNR